MASFNKVCKDFISFSSLVKNFQANVEGWTLNGFHSDNMEWKQVINCMRKYIFDFFNVFGSFGENILTSEKKVVPFINRYYRKVGRKVKL